MATTITLRFGLLPRDTREIMSKARARAQKNTSEALPRLTPSTVVTFTDYRAIGVAYEVDGRKGSLYWLNHDALKRMLDALGMVEA